MSPTTEQFNMALWMAERVAMDDQLYERFGRPLEADHTGEWVAISDEGDVLLGEDDVPLLQRAIVGFGSGRFALRRIGMDADIRMRGIG